MTVTRNENTKNRTRSRSQSLVNIMASVVVVTLTLPMLYILGSSYYSSKTRLNEEIQDLKLLIESVSRFNLIHSSKDHPGGHIGATLSEVIDAFELSYEVGQSELVIAVKHNDQMVFLLTTHAQQFKGALIQENLYQLNKPQYALAFDSKDAIPMQKALRGENGTILDKDYRGVTVLAAFTPVDIGGVRFGIVSKLDASTIWLPWLFAVLAAVVLGIGTIKAGSQRFLRLVNPLIFELEEENSNNRAMINTSPIGIIVLNSDGIIQRFNPAAEQLFGYHSSEVIGLSAEIFTRPQQREQTKAAFLHFLQDKNLQIEGVRTEAIALDRNGQEIPLLLSAGAIPLRDDIRLICMVSDLRNQKKAEKELRNHRDHLKELVIQATDEVTAIINTAVSGIITINEKGLIDTFNPAAQKLFGYTANEVKGSNVSMLMQAENAVHHDNYLMQYLETGKGNIIGKGREIIAKRKDGSTFPAHLSVGYKNIGDGRHFFVGFITDISALKSREQELKHRNKEMNAIIDTAVNGIITIDHDGSIKLFNPAAEKLFGYTAKEVQSQNVSMLMHGKNSVKHDNYIQNYLKTGDAKIIGIGREIYGKRKDGSLFPAHLSVGHADLDDDSHFFVGFITDISDIKQRELELRRAMEDAEAGARAKAAFMANMSHEIRTPMNAIIGFSELLIEGKQLNEIDFKYAKTIETSSKSLLNIINDILDISKLESGKFNLENVCFHFQNALDSAMDTVSFRAAEKSLKLLFEFDEGLPEKVIGDPTRLRQVVLNLIGNAIKFTDHGSVMLKVSATDKADTYHLQVIDTGIGMTETQCNSIFDPFVQADNSISRSYGGTGLGTTISKQIVEMLGGEIWVESIINEGSIFHFTVKLEKAEQNTDADCLYDTDNVITAFISPRAFNVLLAEDVEANAALVLHRMKEMGHTVEWVQNGKLVLEALQSKRFDLILMDVMMPEMDGITTTEEIRKLEQGTDAHQAIIALTAGVLNEDRQRCLDAGMDIVESKPINFDTLFAAMEKLVPADQGHMQDLHNLPSFQSPNQIDFTPLNSIIDHKKALRNWTDPIVFTRNLLRFIENRGDDALTIQTLITADNDLQSAIQITHSLKGLAGNLCIYGVMQSAENLEQAIKNNAIDEATHDLINDLQHQMSLACKAISHLELPAELSEPDTVIDSDPQKAVEYLQQLMECLPQQDPDACESLLRTLSRYVEARQLKPIRKQIDEFEFDHAAALAFALQQELQHKKD